MAFTNLTPHSCAHCRRFVVNIPNFSSDETAYDYVGTFDITFAEICLAASDECSLSQYILKDLDECHFVDPQNIALSLKISGFGGARTETDRMLYFGWWDKTKNISYGSASDGFQFWVHSENMADELGFARPINLTPDSENSFELAHHWFRDCKLSHPECRHQQYETSYMPKRLLEIIYRKESWYLCLRETKLGNKAPYVALSYCWGGGQTIRTTRKRLSSGQDKIPYEMLPKTVRDAIVTTHKLGISFLWIDSLCIFQDDPDDMAREISQMPHIYENASVTIAASRARTVQEGFLQPRNITDSPNLVFELLYRCLNREPGSVILFQVTDMKSGEPLDSRAWALQERHLSSRVLEYGTRQTRWNCPHVKSQLGYSDGWTKDAEDSKTRRNPLYYKFLSPNAAKNTDLSSTIGRIGEMKMIDVWHDLINAYTHRDLTIPSDRILAISGIAERYGNIFGQEYLAGLWKYALPSDLLWKMAHTGKPQRRPQIYQGPSWSWAAVNGPISFDQTRSTSLENGARLIFTGCEIKLSSENAPYGAVEYGHLQVRGGLKPAKWMRNNILSLHNKGWATMEPDAIEGEFIDNTVDFMPIHLLDIGPSDHHPNSSQGLVLRELRNGRFSRLGVYREITGLDDEMEKQRYWLDACETQTITIE